jgi:hypothetical protein
MQIPFIYGDKKINLTPYNTLQEKNILLYNSFCENDINGVLNILKDNIDIDLTELSEIEKKLILYKLRVISVGDDINVKYKCKCGKANESVLNIPFPKDKKIESTYKKFNLNINLKNMVGKFEDVVNHVDISEEELDEMDLNIYEDLEQHIKNNFVNIDLTANAKCFSCGHLTSFNISDEKSIIESLSEDSLMSLYMCISDMIYYSHYNKSDIDTMLPFERTIFYELLLKTKKENNS